MNANTYLRTLGIVCCICLTSCGGSDGNLQTNAENASSFPTNSSSSNLTQSTSTTIEQNQPVLAIANLIEIDLKNQTNLFGTDAQASLLLDDGLYEIAKNQTAILDTEYLDNTFIQIELSAQPASDIPVKLQVKELNSKAQKNQIASLAYFSILDPDDDDGGDTLLTLNSKSDDQYLYATIPRSAFQQKESGKWTVLLKTGIFSGKPQKVVSLSASDPPVSALARSTAPPYPKLPDGTELKLNCPFHPTFSNGPVIVGRGVQNPTAATATVAIMSSSVETSATSFAASEPCIESSRFNELRKLPQKTPGSRSAPHLHAGVDFMARSPKALYVPPGGVATSAYTQKQFNQDTSASCAKAKCDTRATANGRAGIVVTIDYGNYSLRLLHLNSIDSSLLDKDGNLNKEAGPTVDGQIVALSGGSGVGATSPHLHYELYSYTNGDDICDLRGDSRLCYPKKIPLDAFPFMINVFFVDLKSKEGSVLKIGGAYEYRISAAQDYWGWPISSDVNNAYEHEESPPGSDNSPYDPTRKHCLKAENNAAALNIVGKTSGLDGYTCVPWGETIKVTSSDYRPTIELTNRFSSIAFLPPSRDPLSVYYVSSSLDEYILRPSCFFNALEFTAPGQSCELTFGYESLPLGPVSFSIDNREIASTERIGIRENGYHFRVKNGSILGSTTIYATAPLISRNEWIQAVIKVTNIDGHAYYHYAH